MPQKSELTPATPLQRTKRIADILKDRFGVPERRHTHLSPLEHLVLALLSQNTTDKNCMAAFETLSARFPGNCPSIDWQAVADVPATAVADAIRVGGLANQKSERLQSLLRWIFEEHGEYAIDDICRMETDAAIARFTTQKGIGLKTVCIVLCFCCGKDIFPVDTHVHRVCNRLGLVNASTPEKTFHAMKPLVPAGCAYSFHMNIIQLGRTVCRARKTDCPECPVSGECDLYQQDSRRK